MANAVKRAVPVALLALGSLGLGRAAAQTCPAHLFIVARSTNGNVVAYDADPRYASIISGIPGHDVEDVTLTNIRLVYRGGLDLDRAAGADQPLGHQLFERRTDVADEHRIRRHPAAGIAPRSGKLWYPATVRGIILRSEAK